jgi:hypothetical protein
MNPLVLRANAQKLARVSRQNGVTNLAKMQGTTVNIYDTLDLATAGNSPQFFVSANSRTFPLTNVNTNRFANGRSMLIQRFYLSIITRNGGTGQFESVLSIDESNYPQFNLGELTINLAGQTILDQFSVTSSMAKFNKDAKFGMVSNNGQVTPPAVLRYSHSVFNFDLDVVILPDREFSATLRLPAYTAPAPNTVFLRLTLEGLGTLQRVNSAI